MVQHCLHATLLLSTLQVPGEGHTSPHASYFKKLPSLWLEALSTIHLCRKKISQLATSQGHGDLH